MFYVLTSVQIGGWASLIPCRKPIRASCPFKVVQHFSHHADTWPKSLLGARHPGVTQVHIPPRHSKSWPWVCWSDPGDRKMYRFLPSWFSGKWYGTLQYDRFLSFFASFSTEPWFCEKRYGIKFMNLNMSNTGDSSTPPSSFCGLIHWCQASWGKSDGHQRLVLTFPKS